MARGGLPRPQTVTTTGVAAASAASGRARRAIAERGADVSLRTVAQDAGVGIGTLYRHFPTRENLVLGVAYDTWARIDEAVERHRTGWSANPAGAWRATIHEIAALEIGSLAEQIAPFAASDTISAAASVRRKETNSRLTPLLERAVAAGLVSPDVGAASLLVAIALLSRPLPDHIGALLPDHRAWLVDTFLHGLQSDTRASSEPTGAHS